MVEPRVHERNPFRLGTLVAHDEENRHDGKQAPLSFGQGTDHTAAGCCSTADAQCRPCKPCEDHRQQGPDGQGQEKLDEGEVYCRQGKAQEEVQEKIVSAELQECKGRSKEPYSAEYGEQQQVGEKEVQHGRIIAWGKASCKPLPKPSVCARLWYESRCFFRLKI